MELVGVGVEDISGIPVRFGRGAWIVSGVARCRRLFLLPAFTGSVVDGDSGLDIVHIHVKAHALSAILNRERLHLNASGHQFAAFENGSYPIKNMVLRLLDVISHKIFEGEHPLYIHVPGTCDQIFLVGIFSRELEADQMASVVEVLPVVLPVDPAGGSHIADALPLFGGHQIHADVCNSDTTPPQQIQGTVGFEGVGDHIFR